MQDTVSYSVKPSVNFRNTGYQTCEIDGEFYLLGRVLFSQDDAIGAAERKVMLKARYLAEVAASKVHADEALALVRSDNGDYGFRFETDNENEELELLGRVSEALQTSFRMNNTFQSATAFSRELGISGFDALFYAFRDRWRPSVIVTSELLREAATILDQEFGLGFKAYKYDIEAVKAELKAEASPAPGV